MNNPLSKKPKISLKLFFSPHPQPAMEKMATRGRKQKETWYKTCKININNKITFEMRLLLLNIKLS